MSQPCAVDNCKRASRALCHCCQQNLCLSHLSEHDDVLNSQLNPFVDEINLLSERLKKLNFHESINQCRLELEQWRLDVHTKIDQTYEEKCRELDNFFTNRLNEQEKNIAEIRSKVAHLIREQEVIKEDIELTQSMISNIKKELNKIERTVLRIHVRPLMENATMIQLQEVPENLSTTLKSIEYPPGSSGALAESDQSLLIHQKPNLCFINRDLEITKKLLWSYDDIRDICWSSALNQFIVVTRSKIYRVDENNANIDTIEITGNYKWFSCTCFHNKLFLSTAELGSSIVEIDLVQPPYIVSKKWETPISCGKYECIDTIVFNDKSLCLIIMNKVKKTVRLELRSSQTMVCLWTTLLQAVDDLDLAFCCCSINNNEWLVTNRQSKSLVHITADGQIKQTIGYNSFAHRIATFGTNMLAIVTSTRLKFHKLS